VNGVPFQGAEVMLINTYNGVDTVVAFKTAGPNPSLGLAGGRCDNTDRTIEQTVGRELYEESRKTIHISTQLFKNMTAQRSYVDYLGDRAHPGLHGMRRCYICHVPYISTTNYNKNHNILDLLEEKATARERQALDPYLETVDMVRIPMASLAKRVRSVNGVRIQTSLYKAYDEAVRTRIQPFVLTKGSHTQVQNDNVYRGVRHKLTGTIDRYV